MNNTKMLDDLRSRPHRNIFVALVAVLLFDALTPGFVAGAAVSDLAILAILVAATAETVRSKRHAVVAMILGSPAILARLASAVRGDSPSWNSVVLFFTVLFFGFLIWSLLHDVLTGHRTTGERIYGALCAYMLIGILFGLLYAHLEYRFPGSFNIGNEAIAAASAAESAMMPFFTYYSFVTLTTLGYGDITPVAEHARTLAWMEALIGQLYLAVMVATLVGLRVSEAAASARSSGGGSRPGHR